ncbi:MAG: hypothetical protein AB7S77_23940, partial [Desulfatirhabdiaceae bacterium]
MLSRLVFGMLALLLMSSDIRADSPVAMALSDESAWQMNDMRRKTPGWMETTGPDPYVISPVIGIPIQSIIGFYGRLIIHNSPDPVSFQLFYETGTAGFAEIRSYRFQVPVKTGGITEFFLPAAFYERHASLSSDAKLQRIRLDTDNCTGCRIQIQSVQIVTQSDKSQSDLIPTDLVYPIVEKNITPDISQIGPWHPHDMTPNADGDFVISGDDPSMMSPRLNVGLTHITGVFFRLEMAGLDRCRFQLFWNSYSQDYDERHSFWFNAVIKNGIAEFFIPLVVLPKDDILKTIRLDIDGCMGCRFKILSARLVENEFEAMKPLTPRQIMY